MEKKFKLTNETITMNGRILHRIIATTDIIIQNVKRKELGGFVESIDNLSDDAWVAHDAMVFGNARVHGQALVSNNARVYDKAMVFDNAKVFGNARVHGYAKVHDYATVLGDAHVYDNSRVFNFAKVFDKSKVAGSARVSMSGLICGKFESDDSEITNQLVLCGANLHATTNGDIIGYKRVWSTDNPDVFESCYDRNFKYERGEYAEAADAVVDRNVSCGKGLHVSHPSYWDDGNATIMVAFRLEDVLAVNEGKVRVKKLKVL